MSKVTFLRSVYQNGLMVPRAVSVAAPSVWNSLADYLRYCS